MKIGKDCLEGARIPRGYGVAWMYWDRPAFYCLPIPLNVVARLGRSIWLFMRRPWRGDPVMKAYQRGYSDGFDNGRRAGTSEVSDIGARIERSVELLLLMRGGRNGPETRN